MLPIKFKNNRPFVSGEEAKNRFSKWRQWRPSWISHQNSFSYFSSTCHPDGFYKVSCQLAFVSGEKIEFQDGGHGGHLGFSTGMILAIFFFFFILQITAMLTTKFQVNWPFGSFGRRSEK